MFPFGSKEYNDGYATALAGGPFDPTKPLSWRFGYEDALLRKAKASW